MITVQQPLVPFSFTSDGKINIHIAADTTLQWGMQFMTDVGYKIFIRYTGSEYANWIDAVTCRAIAKAIITDVPCWHHALQTSTALEEAAEYCDNLNLALRGTGQAKISVTDYYATGAKQ